MSSPPRLLVERTFKRAHTSALNSTLLRAQHSCDTDSAAPGGSGHDISVAVGEREGYGDEAPEGTTKHTPVALEATSAVGVLSVDNTDSNTMTTTPTPDTSEVSGPSDVEEIVPNTGNQHGPQSNVVAWEHRLSTELHSRVGDVVRRLGPMGGEVIMLRNRADDALDIDIGIFVEFFRKGSNPSDHYRDREARAAYRFYDDYVRMGDYSFLWKIGKKGRIVLTLQRPTCIHTVMRVRRVSLRIGNSPAQPLHFVQGKDFRIQTEIMAYLDASLLNSPRLHETGPEWGEVHVKYVPMNVLIEVTIGGASTLVYDLILTMYCKVMANRRTPIRFVMQAIERKWREAPQWLRTTTRAIPRAARAAGYVSML